MIAPLPGRVASGSSGPHGAEAAKALPISWWAGPPSGGGLQVAARHVEPDGIAINRIRRGFGRQVAAAGFESRHQLDLELHVEFRGG